MVSNLIFIDPRLALYNFKLYYYHLLLDIKMPNLNGCELSRELTKSDKNPKSLFSDSIRNSNGITKIDVSNA